MSDMSYSYEQFAIVICVKFRSARLIAHNDIDIKIVYWFYIGIAMPFVPRGRLASIFFVQILTTLACDMGSLQQLKMLLYNVLGVKFKSARSPTVHSEYSNMCARKQKSNTCFRKQTFQSLVSENRTVVSENGLENFSVSYPPMLVRPL